MNGDIRLEKRKLYMRNYMREYLRSNFSYKEKQRLRDKKRYQEQRERILAYQALYDFKNRERILLKKQEYIRTEKGKLSNKRKTTNYKNREKKLLNDLTFEQWMEILQSQNHCCGLCERNFEEHHLKIYCDHIYLVSKTTTIGDKGLTFDNVQALCHQCNSTKGSKIYTLKSYFELKKKCLTKYNMGKNSIILNERVKKILELNERREQKDGTEYCL